MVTTDKNKKRKHDAEVIAESCVSALNCSGPRVYLMCVLQTVKRTCFVISQSQSAVWWKLRKTKGRETLEITSA